MKRTMKIPQYTAEQRRQAEAQVEARPQSQNSEAFAAAPDALHQVQKELTESRERYFELYDLAPVGYCTLAENGRIREANLTAATMLGLRRDALLQKPLSQFIFKEDQDIFTRFRKQLAAMPPSLPDQIGGRKSCELRMQRADGSVFWGYLETLIAQESSCEFETRVVFSDITERKQGEAEILRLNAELEQRVAERTAKLEALNKELEAFSYSVSHDLKAPLRGIDGYCRLLEEDYLDRLGEEGRRFIGNIRQGAAQMHELIEDLLNYSRFERRSLQPAIIDLAEVVRVVAAEKAAEVDRLGAVLLVTIPSVKARVDCDGFVVVLRNLLDNALKFSHAAHPPTVEIGARREGDKALLWVRDNGIGFDMKFHDRIFEIFQRLQRSEEFPGTGIGLALVDKAVKRMDGRVWAESSPGQGATFFLELPL